MVMSLPIVCKSQKFLRKPIFALIMMILNPEDYEPDKGDSSLHASLSSADLLRLESDADHHAATKIVKKIMKHYSLTENTIKARLDVAGEHWAEAGDDYICLEFLA